MATLDYHQSVNYSQADPLKVLAQKQGRETAKNLPFGYKEVEGTRGESAYVFRMGDHYGALVQEGLGTKSLIAQAVYEKTGDPTDFKNVAQDTVACVINDLVSSGATPVVLNAYWSSSSYEWLADQKLAETFIKGWREACDKAGVTWGGGETQSLSGVIKDGAVELAGSAFGFIQDKKNLVQGKNLKADDVIVLVEASGPHANGISLIRQIADELPDGYQTKLPSGQTLGEAALQPTHLYAGLVRALQAADVDIHYLSNITGHGWRKIMRAEQPFLYVMDTLPETQEIFQFIEKQSGNTEQDMYGNYNMGAGYAVYVTPGQSRQVIDIAAKQGLKAWVGGHLEEGDKEVIITPLDIHFKADSLEVR